MYSLNVPHSQIRLRLRNTLNERQTVHQIKYLKKNHNQSITSINLPFNNRFKLSAGSQIVARPNAHWSHLKPFIHFELI